MRLVNIEGNIWELTILHSDKYATDVNDTTSLFDKNIRAIKGLGWFRGVVRVLARNQVKSKAVAIIETDVSGLLRQMKYDVYHNQKGFFCRVNGNVVYLKDLVGNKT